MYILYLIIGLYIDGDGRHSTGSVELYLPWSDSWIPLPELPHFTWSDGTVLPMTDTHIMSLALTDSAYSLRLVGGGNYDWNTVVERVTSKVWQLCYNLANHTHYWDNNGVYGVWCSHVVIL